MRGPAALAALALALAAGCEKAGEDRPAPPPVRLSDAGPIPPAPARQDFADCGTCGAAAMVGEMGEAKRLGQRVRGYTFFHDQDTEGVLDGGLFLAYGAAVDGEAAAVAIGYEVVRTLRAEGLTVDWNGDFERRIGVQLDWRKRRFTQAPAR